MQKSRNPLRIGIPMALACLLLTASGVAQEEASRDISDVSLEDLLKVSVSVATKTALSLRETPSIVSLVTEEEIANSGARDLIDVLRLIPGFDFGVDVQGVVGIGVRGNWAHEGKALLLVDGQEFNEALFSNIPFGRHFPVDSIRRVEVIRGPGSAIYGGYAELAVINIITKGAEDLNGAQVSSSYGVMGDALGQRNVSVSAGTRRKDLAVAVTGSVSQGNRSDRNFVDVYGDSYPMADASELNHVYLNASLQYKGFGSRFFLDRYHTTMRDAASNITPWVIPIDFQSLFLDFWYDIKVNDKLTVTPRFKFRRQEPWKSNTADVQRMVDEYPGVYDFLQVDKTSDRITANVTATYDPFKRLNIVAGTEFFREKATDRIGLFSNNLATLSYNNAAFFGQGLIKTPVVDIAVGARFDRHSRSGSSFVPRFGVMRHFDRVHFKFLYSRAFRAPGIENLNLNPLIRPEKTTVLEFEVGYLVSKSILVTVNFYDIKIRNPIVYFYDVEDPVQPEKYVNFPRTGTRGLEMEWRFKGNWGYVTANYSYYRANDNRVPAYGVPGDDGVLLAFPAHKLTVNGHLKLTKRLSVNPSLVYLSKRYGVSGLNEAQDDAVISSFDPKALVNLYFQYKETGVKGLTLGFGVANLLNAKYSFLQPYSDGWHAPYPDRSREFYVKATYVFQAGQ